MHVALIETYEVMRVRKGNLFNELITTVNHLYIAIQLSSANVGAMIKDRLPAFFFFP